MKKRNIFFKSIFFAVSFLTATPLIFAQESISFTSYYPSPFGAYDRVRLVPRSGIAVCDASTEGTMYYDNSVLPHTFKVCMDQGGGPGWVNVGDSLWAKSASSLFAADPTWNVGVGTTTPQFGRISIEDVSVPLAFHESDNVNPEQWWRMPVDGGQLRFDVSTGGAGSEFNPYLTPLSITNEPLVKVQDSLRIDDHTFGPNYSLFLERFNNHGDAWLLHNARYNSGDDTLEWITSHLNFGSQGIRLSYINGLSFYADNVPTTAGATFTPTTRMIINGNGRIGVNTVSPQGTLHVNNLTGQGSHFANIVLESNGGTNTTPRFAMVDTRSGGVTTQPAWFFDNNNDNFRIFRQPNLTTGGNEFLRINNTGVVTVPNGLDVTWPSGITLGGVTRNMWPTGGMRLLTRTGALTVGCAWTNIYNVVAANGGVWPDTAFANIIWFREEHDSYANSYGALYNYGTGFIEGFMCRDGIGGGDGQIQIDVIVSP